MEARCILPQWEHLVQKVIEVSGVEHRISGFLGSEDLFCLGAGGGTNNRRPNGGVLCMARGSIFQNLSVLSDIGANVLPIRSLSSNGSNIGMPLFKVKVSRTDLNRGGEVDEGVAVEGPVVVAF